LWKFNENITEVQPQVHLADNGVVLFKLSYTELLRVEFSVNIFVGYPGTPIGDCIRGTTAQDLEY